MKNCIINSAFNAKHFFMIISIEDLRNNIQKRFDKHKDSSYFGVAETVYNYKTDALILKVKLISNK